MSEELTIHGYPHGGIEGEKPRKPMVHMLVFNEYGSLQSISFHPVYAESIANSILKAAKAAKAGRSNKPIKLMISSDLQ